jgi:oligosaccharide repeat unit polymerase
MQVIYLLLQIAALSTYSVVLAKTLRTSRALNPLLGWMAGLGFFLVTPLTIIVFNGGFTLPLKLDVGQSWGSVDFRTTDFLLPYLVVWTALMASCMIIYFFSPSPAQEDEKECPISRPILERAIWITMALSVVDWASMIHLVGGLDVFLVSHWYHRNEELVSQYGDSFVLLEHFSLANQIVFTCAASLYTALGLKYRDTRMAFTLMILFFFLLEVVMSGNRIFLACYLLGILISCLVYGRRRILVGMIALAPLLILIFSVWASVRHDITAIPDSVGSALEEESGNSPFKSIVSASMDATEGMDTLLLLHIPNDFGHRTPYLYGISYSRAITSLIPRAIYPHKPQNFTSFLASVYLPGLETSLNATAVGEMYANFGPITLLLFPLLSLSMVFLTAWGTRKQDKHGLLLPLLFVLAIWAARSTLEDSIVTLILAYSIIFVFRLEKGLNGQVPNSRATLRGFSDLPGRPSRPILNA